MMNGNSQGRVEPLRRRRRTRVFLARHGEVEGFEEKRYNGQSNVALTSRGWQQYRELQERLRCCALQAIYSSDLDRCLGGATLVAQPHGLTPQALPALRELHIGTWEGITWRELARRFPREWQARLQDIVHFRVPGGENLVDLAERVLPAVQDLVARHMEEDILLVAHGAVNRIILLDALTAPLEAAFRLEQDYACLNIIDYFDDGFCTVRLLNAPCGC
jgi:alpha-ribazole phosphatase/probable phosphoglycerate mutase